MKKISILSIFIMFYINCFMTNIRSAELTNNSNNTEQNSNNSENKSVANNALNFTILVAGISIIYSVSSYLDLKKDGLPDRQCAFILKARAREFGKNIEITIISLVLGFITYNYYKNMDKKNNK